MFLSESFPWNRKTDLYNLALKRTITYSSLALKLLILRKYAFELIPVKCYKKSLVFLMEKTPEIRKKTSEIRNQKLFFEASKCVFTVAYPISYLKTMSHFIPILPSILEPSRLLRNLSPPQGSIDKKLLCLADFVC